jgi:glycosyltransferase involved in cell wall biosynthesis
LDTHKDNNERSLSSPDDTLLFSIIVPVYNAGEFLSQNIKSLLRQTYTNFELICVDDGSTDDSLTTLKSFEPEDCRIKVLTQENQGSAVARNTGIRIASGDYIIFLDADDLFSENLVQSVANQIIQYPVDILVYNFTVLDECTKEVTRPIISTRNIPEKEVFTAFDVPDCIWNTFSNNVWNKAFRRDFLVKNALTFDAELRRAQDALFTSIALVLAESINYLDVALVTYRLHENNSWKTINRYPLSGFGFLEKLYDFLQDRGIHGLYKRSFNRLYVDDATYSLEKLSPFPEFSLAFEHAKRFVALSNIEDSEANREEIHLILHGEEKDYLRLIIRKRLESEHYFKNRNRLLSLEINRIGAELARANGELDGIKSSRTWRYTGIIRAAAAAFRHRFKA